MVLLTLTASDAYADPFNDVAGGNAHLRGGAVRVDVCHENASHLVVESGFLGGFASQFFDLDAEFVERLTLRRLTRSTTAANSSAGVEPW